MRHPNNVDNKDNVPQPVISHYSEDNCILPIQYVSYTITCVRMSLFIVLHLIYRAQITNTKE
jgi:hypothetical protein